MHRFFLLCMMVFACAGQSVAQGPPVKGKAVVPPFRGTIGYQLKYTGYAPEAVPFLPDSMTAWFDPPLFRVRYHGGLADTLGHELMWNAETPVYYLIDPQAQAAFTMEGDFAEPVKGPLKAVGTDSLLGLRLKVYEITVRGGKDRYAISDSLRFPYVLADSLQDSLGRVVPPFFLAGQEGIPLRVKRTGSMVMPGKPLGTKPTPITCTATAVTIRRDEISIDIGRMPSGYEVKEFEPRPIRHPIAD